MVLYFSKTRLNNIKFILCGKILHTKEKHVRKMMDYWGKNIILVKYPERMSIRNANSVEMEKYFRPREQCVPRTWGRNRKPMSLIQMDIAYSSIERLDLAMSLIILGFTLMRRPLDWTRLWVSCHAFNKTNVFTAERLRRAEPRRPNVLNNRRAAGLN